MHRVEAALEPANVFAMLVEQQLQSVPGCSEPRRELTAATEGAGVTGLLAMQIAHDSAPSTARHNRGSSPLNRRR
jgi:hypothetical protein